ncbi:hypothetical protein BAUCODRAFT_163226 [Baudoinia panamericana UAMH 10762]|uniref:Uncharacterized protein n=1 Tax=Baudoinia panamericana (strain UAMH 10762) TaxID=717646 RepID=M2NMI9_BAUPA|nr:uncharacterized protein BAUCODRAFT_163226 [Baudoinia panamericana UAMH 10762]EMD00401.1 hypothetical protein BAUCODRAFT_163226 [Baudoinia panamericana UAMH 10762]
MRLEGADARHGHARACAAKHSLSSQGRGEIQAAMCCPPSKVRRLEVPYRTWREADTEVPAECGVTWCEILRMGDGDDTWIDNT